MAEVAAEARTGWRGLAAPAPLTALAWTAFQLAVYLWPAIDTLVQRATHVSFGVALALLLTHSSLRSGAARALNYALAVAAALPAIYIVASVDRIMNERISGIDPVTTGDYAFGLLLILLLAEVGRRTLGVGMTVLAGVFVAYHFAGPYIPGALGHSFGGLERFVDSQFLTLHGLFGVPVGVSAEIVFYFILFAAVYDVFGGGRMIIDFALAAAGRRAGGPAKAAVIASGMMGSVSGSAVANVMSTGIFTIPLMKRVGYQPRFAAAVEAVASTGGQLVPPVMGAAAFIMADLLQIPYAKIVIAAILPALLYYIALLVAVHLQARKDGLGAVDAAELPRLRDTFRTRGHMLIPLAWLCYQVVIGYPVDHAAVQATVIAVLCGAARATTRAPLVEVVHALAAAAERTVSVAIPCAVAGIIVGVVAYSGLGTKFTSLMVLLSGGWLPAMLLFAMLGSLVLGCGMPTTSAYIMAAVLIAPALIVLKLEPIVAHFFIFYFAILSMVTPPVALASYAAAAVAKAPASSTGWTGFVLAIPGFIIPFAVVLHPGLLLTGDFGDAAWGVANVLVGFLGLAAAITGFLFRPLGPGARAYFALIGVANVLPGALVSVITFTALAAGALFLWRSARERSPLVSPLTAPASRPREGGDPV